MLKIGIRAHDLGKYDFENLLEVTKQAGFDYIQLVLYKAVLEEDGFLNHSKVEKYNKALKNKSIKIAMLGAYFNPVHHDENKVALGIERFKNYLEYASSLNCNYVGSETGSYNDDKWTYNPLNRTEAAYQKVLKVFTELVNYSSTCNIVIEAAYGHVIYNPQILKRLVDDLDSDKVKVTIDLFNYLSINNHENRYEILQEAISLLKERIVIFHLKDYIIENDTLKQVGLGRGLMDYPKIINIIKKSCPNAYLIFEGVRGDDIKTSKTFIDLLNK